jgi:hypothetical protein
MLRRPPLAIAMLLSCSAIFVAVTLSGQPQPQNPSAPSGAGSPDFERRISRLENQQALTIASLERAVTRYENVLFLLAAFATAAGTIIVGLHAFSSLAQHKREQAQDARQAAREVDRDAVDKQGVESVSKILDVVYRTQDAHLAAEDKTKGIQKQLDRVNLFLDTHQQVINRNRGEIEQSAKDLAGIPRHEFRRKASPLGAIAARCDLFERDFSSLDDSGRSFSARVGYIRGVAAHYGNQPDLVSRFLGPVVLADRPESDEPLAISYQKRVASAYYFLGITLSNFNKPEALSQFEAAIKAYPDPTDYLSRLVTVEAYLMQGRDAGSLLDEVDAGTKLRQQQDSKSERLYVRLRSRSKLIRANSLLMPHTRAGIKPHRAVLENVRNLLEPVVAKDPEDPDYYYATATFAQVLLELGDDRAEQYFRSAHELIRSSFDLVTVAETRSKILIRLFAAICCFHIPEGADAGKRYLGEANNLIDDLPKLETKTCTVFSPLSKWNEETEMLRQQIEWIREGRVLAWMERRTTPERRKAASQPWPNAERRKVPDRRTAA